ncbi:hypothetical protein VT98_14512, partial [Candidatus Electrothrix communis]
PIILLTEKQEKIRCHLELASQQKTSMNEQPDPSWKPEEQRGVQPFALVKYFSFTSLSVILVASFVLTWSFSNNARDTMLDRSESYSRMFAENLNRQVFHSFVIPTVIRFGRIALSDDTQFELLDQMVHNITRGMNIEAVTIFDSRENIVSYSTDAALVGKKNIGGLEYKKALAGESTSVLISNGSMLNLLPGASPMFCTLKTYVPFRQERRSVIVPERLWVSFWWSRIYQRTWQRLSPCSSGSCCFP